jgi:ketosteroid isomerase-like protein
MTETIPSAIEVAGRLFAAIEQGDIDGVAACYADDVVIWHNDSNRTEDRSRNLRTLAWVIANVREVRYEEVRRQATADGFVQQHVLRGIAPGGAALALPACIVCTVVDGKITRLDEYLDSAQTAVLRA